MKRSGSKGATPGFSDNTHSVSNATFTDGGEDYFSSRVGEMIEEIEAEVDDSTPVEAELYARCSAAFEDAVNNTDLPAENALGVMTAALFEAADQSGYARSDVIETAREYYVDDDVDRGDGVETDGGTDCFYCDLETEGAHPTCDRPGCDRQTHGDGPEGKRVLSYCPSCRDNALVADGGIAEHYWVPCRFCDKKTVVFERFCRHCDADRQQHRPVEERDPIADGGHIACVKCGRYYDRSEYNGCPHCRNADLGEFVTDGGEPVASTGGGRHAPAMDGATTDKRTYAHYCDEVGSTVYAARRRCPLECYRDDGGEE